MAQNKTQASLDDVDAYLAGVEPDQKRQDAQRLNTLFKEVTGFTPRLWGGSIIGYGRYHYVYDSGREGDFLATGFAPRKSYLSVYIMPGYADFSDHLSRLGKHKAGKSCLNINKLNDIDETELRDLIEAGLKDLAQKWPVHPD